MRRRSSHLVFLVLLACSVQLRDDLTLQLANGQVYRRSSSASQRHGMTALPANQTVAQGGNTSHLAVPTSLDPASWTAHRTVWTMRRPARAATAVNNHTSLLRA
jgi:hypothetical protein